MMKHLMWFRRDLRLADNPALRAVLRAGGVIPVYLHVPGEDGAWAPGAASRWWLHHSLTALDEGLQRRGSRLLVRQGDDSLKLLLGLLKDTGAAGVYCSRLYEPAAMKRDRRIQQALQQRGYSWQACHGQLLFEPAAVQTRGGTPYRVFTPFWRECQRMGLAADTVPAPRQLPAVAENIKHVDIGSLELLPQISWDSQFYDRWQPGERFAQLRLHDFLDAILCDYDQGRNFPGRVATSMLSASLHFGEISPRQIVHAVEVQLDTARSKTLRPNAESFLRELGWREFTHHVLFHYPHTTDKPLDARFADFPWQTRRTKFLAAWQQGRTGFPIVDAGMRELWATGYMHNRVRMIVASLLTKNAGIHWRQGARWFWDTLVDADLAQNSFNWQWVAGCGADAAPFFRIFNPVTQSEKFDARGRYLRQWLPELSALPDKWIHAPWTAPAAVLAEHGIRLGRDYPQPILELKPTREAALRAYRSHIKG
jgi:deoxyribodipyrimidine photo-lyase